MLVCQRGVLAAAKADAEEVIEMRGTLDRPLIVEAEVALALLRLALFCFQTWEVNNFGKTAAADSASRFGSASRPPAPQTPKCTGHDRRLVSRLQNLCLAHLKCLTGTYQRSAEGHPGSASKKTGAQRYRLDVQAGEQKFVKPCTACVFTHVFWKASSLQHSMSTELVWPRRNSQPGWLRPTKQRRHQMPHL